MRGELYWVQIDLGVLTKPKQANTNKENKKASTLADLINNAE